MFRRRTRPDCIGLLLLGTAGCAADANQNLSSVIYACADGVSFSALFHSGAVTLRTATGTYRLERRGGSLERYGSEGVAFVRDENTAVLVGAGGGPFEECVEASS